MALDPALKIYFTRFYGPAPDRNHWGGALGFLEDNYPDVYLELWLLDRAADGVFFSDPNHTLSWSIATRAAAGNQVAKFLCDGLNALSPGHCKVVLTNGGQPDDHS